MKKTKEDYKVMDVDEISALTKKFFWEQKLNELCRSMVILFIATMLISICGGVGTSFQSNGFACNFMYGEPGAKDVGLYDACMGNTLGVFQTIGYGFVMLLLFIIIPLGVLFGIGWLIYEWINSNLDQATKRAIEELKGE